MICFAKSCKGLRKKLFVCLLKSLVEPVLSKGEGEGIDGKEKSAHALFIFSVLISFIV